MTSPVPKPRRITGWLVGIVLAISSAWAVLQPIRHGIHWMYFEQDDFFYYLKIAQSLAAGRGSTFNGLVATNGYHPLWMLTLAAVVKLGAAPRGIFLFLAFSIWAATMATYLFAWKLLRSSGVEWLLSAFIAAYVAIYAAHVFSYGMEVTLAVPLMFGLLGMVQKMEWWGAQSSNAWLRSFGIGLVATATILARLDTMIFVALLGVGALGVTEARRRIGAPQLVGVGLGLLPLAAYFLSNHFYFGVWMPVSGMSKQLKLDHGFTGLAWMSLVGKSPLQLVNLLPGLLALLALPWLWKRLKAADRVYVPGALLFPFLYIFMLSCLSDWPLWGWYFYAFRPALCVGLMVLLQLPQIKRLAYGLPAAALLALCFILQLPSLAWPEQQPEIVDAAADVQQFSLTHPGTYAMGDRSGAVGYLLQQPVVQTEGLVMDKKFLRLMAQQTPLSEVLASYGVRYYVGSSRGPYSGCFQAVEPAQAGQHAPHMRAELCQHPVASWTHSGVTTLVFDVQQPAR